MGKTEAGQGTPGPAPQPAEVKPGPAPQLVAGLRQVKCRWCGYEWRTGAEHPRCPICNPNQGRFMKQVQGRPGRKGEKGDDDNSRPAVVGGGADQAGNPRDIAAPPADEVGRAKARRKGPERNDSGHLSIFDLSPADLIRGLRRK